MFYLFSLSDWGFADVACYELGYGPPERVEYATPEVVGYAMRDMAQISLNNPYCNLFTTLTMETCGEDYQSEPCTQENNVYVKCSGKFEP